MSPAPMWLERAGRLHWNGRDLRGHYYTLHAVAEARFHGRKAPRCPHACCQGRRAHPPGVRVVKWTESGLGRRGAGRSAKARSKDAAGDRKYDYESYLDAQYRAAAAATNGYMVNAAGRARGYSSDNFFRAGRRASIERWGTDEMRAWVGSEAAAGVDSRGSLMTKTAFERQHRR